MSEEKKTPTKETKTKTKTAPAKKAEPKAAKKTEPKTTKKVEKAEKIAKVEEVKKVEKTEPTEKAEKVEQTKSTEKVKTKKSHKGAIITWSIIGGVLLVGGITCAIVLPIILNQVSYREAYTISKDLKSNIRDFYYNYDYCVKVVDRVDDDWYSTSSYDDYIKNCKDAIKADTIQKVEALSNTSAVQKDENIKVKYAAFSNEWNKAMEGIDDSAASKMETYSKWHKFIYEADVSFSTVTEEKLNTIAGYAADTGVDAFKTYGENWLAKAKEIRNSYKNDKYSIYRGKLSDFEDWIEENQPKIEELIPLPFKEDNSNEVYNTFGELRETITEEYSKHYDDSGECTKVPYINTVVCD